MSRQDDIKKLIINHTRRLQKLKEQQAIGGTFVDPKILIEIEDIEAEVENLRIELKEINGVIAEDGQLIQGEQTLAPPLDDFDPFFIEELYEPGGTVKLRDQFYIERKEDSKLKRQITKRGTITTIRASRQTGKSSLLVRALQHAQHNGSKVVRIDLQTLDKEYLQSPDTFLRCLAEFVVRQLRVGRIEIAKAWTEPFEPQVKLTYFLEDYIFPNNDTPIILAIDEADKLLYTDFHSDFFGLIRSWHNQSAHDERWEKFSIVLVISTEPFLLIADLNQSPFNVGLKLYLNDFDEDQVNDLYERHRLPMSGKSLPAIMNLLNGHPYLTRKAFYAMVTEGLTWTDLERKAIADNGAFADHLNHQYRILLENPTLREALRQVVHYNRTPDETALYRLLRAGLIKGNGKSYSLRCDLYRRYFEQKL